MQELDLSNIKSRYDVVVVGAGPAGCIFANEISSKYSVLLVEEKTIPRKKPCGGILVTASKDFLSDFNMPDDIFAEPKLIDLIYLDLKTGVEKEAKKNFLNIDRVAFDHWLFGLLKNKNIDFVSNTKLIEFKDNDMNITSLLSSNGQIVTVSSKKLISSEGAFSVIRKRIFGNKTTHYLAMQQNAFDMGVGCLNKAYFIYDERITDFFSWIIPKNGKFVVGSALSIKDANYKFSLFKSLIANRFAFKKWSNKKEAALILRPNNINEIFLGSDNILLTGEAAGLISNTSAEGISFALRSGRLCAKALNENFEKPSNKYHELCYHLVKEISNKIFKKI
ncbi:MAG: FAD-dependent monooxygenase [archaeon]